MMRGRLPWDEATAHSEPHRGLVLLVSRGWQTQLCQQALEDFCTSALPNHRKLSSKKKWDSSFHYLQHLSRKLLPGVGAPWSEGTVPSSLALNLLSARHHLAF